jgi:MATE family, multidrug efflux pump
MLDRVRDFLSSWHTEAGRLIRLGSPILVGQIAQTGMGTVDTIMAGNYGARDLAAIAIAQSIWLPVLVFFIGLFTATTTTVARHFGGGDLAGVKSAAQQSLWLAFFCAPLTIFLLLNSNLIIAHLGLEARVGAIAQDYLFYLCFGLPAANLFLAMRGFTDGQGITRPMMTVNILAFLCNIPLNYLFIFGSFGMPELGGAGCGLATGIVLWVQFVGLLVITRTHRSLKNFPLLPRFPAPDWSTLRRLLSLGLPSGMTGLAEVSLFSALSLIVAPLGTQILAANQVAISISGLIYMLPLSMGIAINIRVGIRLGANDHAGARYSSLVGASAALCFAVLSLSIILIWRQQIAQLYSTDPAIILGASTLLVYAAIYQIPDALQVAVISALRAYHDTRVPLLLVLLSYWIISIPLGWSLTWGIPGIEPLGAEGIWIGLVCGLICAAVMQSLRFRHVLKTAGNPGQGV